MKSFKNLTKIDLSKVKGGYSDDPNTKKNVDSGYGVNDVRRDDGKMIINVDKV